MSLYRCPICGAKKFPQDQFCMPCASWNRKQSAGSAPEFGRGKGESAAKTKGTASPADSALSRSVFRHPAGKTRIWALGAYPCFLHHQPDRFECEGCLRNFELDHEMGADA